jgi:signal transduction histidine kinase
VASAALCTVVGSAMAVLWIIRPVALAERLPHLFLMQFSTAVCFVLIGVGFAALLKGARRTASVLALAAMAIALAFLLETLFSNAHPLDSLIVEPFRVTGPRPGHLASGVSLSFLLVGLCILVSAVTGRATMLRIILAATIFMAAAAALLGHALQILTGAEWPQYGHMSPQTAFCFAVIALPMIYHRVEELGFHRSTITATLGAASYLLLLLLTLIDMQKAHEAQAVHGGSRDSLGVLAGLLVVSGIVYACLIVFAFRSAQRDRESAAALHDSQQRLAAIIDTAGDGMVTIDADGTILSVNRATEAIFGHRSDAMVGDRIDMLIPALGLPPGAAGATDASGNPMWPQAPVRGRGGARGETTSGSGWELDGLRRDGRSVPLDISIAHIVLKNHILYSAIIRDISQRKRHERDILEANAELEEFSYRTSHDLRSPIASSIGLIAIMRDMIGLGATTSEIVPVIDRLEGGLDKLDRLIENIIQLKRSRVLEEPNTEVPVAALVAETIERLRFMGAGRMIAFTVTIPDDLVLETRLGRFQMILDNLLSNAIKYADLGIADPSVCVETTQGDGWLEIGVSDNGIGIDPRDAPSLFQMFKRFHPGHAYGSGLGLYILRKSAEHLNGTVAYQRLDKGSRFVVRLPKRQDP